MSRITSCLLVISFLLAACGNGDNTGNARAEPEPYTPDFSTPAGATEAYARAIEDQNEELMKSVMIEADKAEKLEAQLKNIRQSKELGVDWELDFESGEYLGDNMVVTKVTFSQVKNGVKTPMESFPVIFVKTEDGTWRFSPVATKEYQDIGKQAKAPEEQPGNVPDETPGDDEELPANEG